MKDFAHFVIVGILLTDKPSATNIYKLSTATVSVMPIISFSYLTDVDYLVPRN